MFSAIRVSPIVFFLLTCFSFSFGSRKPSNATYPFVEIANNDLKAIVLLPDAVSGYYRGVRFDWSAIVAQVYAGENTYFQNWENYDGIKNSGIHNPMDLGTATGTAEEFREPLGYHEARVTGQFIKVGVGVLERDSCSPQEYHWDYPYKLIQSGDWSTEIFPDRVAFNQELNSGLGYGYQLCKEVLLKDCSILVRHVLKNTGTKLIETNPYCHNFFRLNDEDIGDNYEIVFPHSITPLGDFSQQIICLGERIRVSSLLTGNNYLGGAVEVHRSKVFTVKNKNTKTSVEVQSDVEPGFFYLWMSRTSFCPEPMIFIRLLPGESFEWNTTYVFQ